MIRSSRTVEYKGLRGLSSKMRILQLRYHLVRKVLRDVGPSGVNRLNSLDKLG